MYPNPSKDNINIIYNSSKEGEVKIKLFDAAGRIVFIKNDTAIKGQNVYHLNLSKLTAGVYYAELNNNVENERTKVMIEK